MANFLDEIIATLLEKQVAIFNAIGTINTCIYNAGGWLELEDFEVAGGYLKACQTPIWQLKIALSSGSTGAIKQIRDGFTLIQDNWPSDGAEFDMGTLLSTMLAANPDETLYFIGLVDAYRTSVWNREFNEEYFAALARGFMVWP